jgi:hypothetical protein
MTTQLNKTLKRELEIENRRYVVTLTPESLKITLKGHRKGIELQWRELVSGDAALAVALTASVAGTRARSSGPSETRKRQSD